MGLSLAIPRVIPNDWKRLDLIVNKIKMRLGRDSSPTLTGLTLSGLTQGSVVFAGASGVLSQDNDKLFWDATNFRLGIGTSSPGSKLHINSAEVTSTTLLTLESDINNNNEYNEILFKIVGGQNYGAIRSCVGAIGGDSYMSFFTTTDSGTLVRQVTIQHNGKVGLGTYNPETLLTIVSAAPYLTLHNVTEEDTDGGGESRLIYKRERSGGEPTAAFQFEASHDGSSDDQLGKGVWSVNTGAGLVEGMRLDSSLTATFAGVVQATDFAKTGWPVTPGVILSFVGGTTRTFTVTDGGSAYYYIDGVKYTLGENKTVVIDDLEGLWFIYFDGAALTASQTIWSFADEDKAIVAYLYWARDVGTPANGKAIFIGWELHSFHMSGATHARLHYAGGARWETGLLVADNLDNTVDVSAGDIWDEDLNIPITDGVGSALFEQVLSPAQLPIYYREGASAWRIYETNEKAALTDVGYLTGGNLKYNDPTTTWSNETVGLNNYVAYYVVATNEQTEPVVLVMGQQVDNKLSEAQANNVFAGLSLAGLPFEELAVLARLILKDTGTYTLEEVLDLRAYNIKGNITSPLITQHAGLGGLNWSSSGHYFDAAVDFNAQNISNIGTVGCGVITQSGATLAATYQPLDDVLTDLAALTAVADNEFIVGTGAGTYAHESGATARTSLGLVIGTNVQAWDAGLDSLAALTYVSDSFIKVTAENTYVIRTIAETKTDLSLNLVENTALSTWAGTANITTLGTITTVGAITGQSTATFEGASVTVGKASTTTGTLILHDSGSANTITLTVPNALAGSLTFTLPPTDGDNLDVLQTNGSGVLTWVAPGGGGTWIALTDTDPANYTGQAGNTVVVNAGEDGLEFGAAPGGAFTSKCRVSLTSTQSVPTAGGYTKLLLATEQWDTDGEWASNRFTPTAAGYYHVSYQIQVSALGVNKLVLGKIYKNGAAYSSTDWREGNLAATSISCVGSDDVYLNGSTDYIEIFVVHTHGSNRNFESGTDKNYIAIHRFA